MSDYHMIVSLAGRVDALERTNAEQREAINMIARGMSDLVAIYESLHVRTTGEGVRYATDPGEDDIFA